MNLLPGIRDLRTPLAVGYLWLAALWLAFGDKLPDSRQDATGIIDGIYRAVSAVGVTPSLAALTFIAYVVGAMLLPLGHEVDSFIRSSVFALSQLVPRSLRNFQTPRDEYGLPKVNTSYPLEQFAREEIDDLRRKYPVSSIVEALRDVDQPTGALIDWAGMDHERQQRHVHGAARTLAHQLQWDLPAIVTQLQIYDKESLFHSYDRNMAESQFRMGISAPLLAIASILAREVTPWALLGVIVPLVLQHQGRQKQEEAELKAFQPVTQGVIQAPYLQTVKSKLEEAKRVGERRHWGIEENTP
jgi:hypothetical protein